MADSIKQINKNLHNISNLFEKKVFKVDRSTMRIFYINVSDTD